MARRLKLFRIGDNTPVKRHPNLDYREIYFSIGDLSGVTTSGVLM
jgi:hypothetical protein